MQAARVHAVRIGAVAKQTGLTIDTIRFYEKKGLLGPSARTEGGFRLFGPGEIQTLKFIRRSQQLGFSLGEIREMLVLRDGSAPVCVHVKDLLERKLADVHQKIEELQTLEAHLSAVLRKCNRMLKSGRAEHTTRCPVLEKIRLETERVGEVQP